MDPQTELYLITPKILDLVSFPSLLENVLDTVPIAAVQLFLPDIPQDKIVEAIAVLKPIVQDHESAFILYNHPELAVKTYCDGVHINSSTPEDIKKIRSITADLQLGVSCHNSRHTAMQAGELGIDYVSFGPVFDNTLPQDTSLPNNTLSSTPSLELISWWSSMMELPVVAEGYITPENCGILVQKGADFLALQESVWHHPEGALQAIKSIYTTIS